MRATAPPSRPARAHAPPPRRGPPPTAASAAPAVVVLPGLGNSAADYAALAASLTARGAAAVEVAPVARWEWARNASGALKRDYWAGTLAPRPTVDWYLAHIDAALDAVAAATNGAPVTLLAHSAGGWLGRVWLLGDGRADAVAAFVSVGSPHAPPPPEARVPDQTRGILTWVQANTPGAFHDGIAYTTVASRYVKGAALRDADASLAAKAAGFGYEAVCGDARAWGDAIVPVDAAHLEGARQITLEGVYHSPLGAGEERPWDGSESVLGQWVEAVGVEGGVAA